MKKDHVDGQGRTVHTLGADATPPFLAAGGRAEHQQPDPVTGASPFHEGIAGIKGRHAHRSDVDHGGDAYRLTMGQFVTGSVLDAPTTDKNRAPLSDPSTFIQPAKRQK